MKKVRYLIWDDKLKWLWVAIFVITIVGLTLPFIYRRPGEDWRPVERRGSAELSLEERFFQFNTDQRGWIRLGADFPFHYWEDDTRINRPVYPALLSVLCRPVQGMLHLPQDGVAAFSSPCSIPLTFVSSVVLNLIILSFSVFGFYHIVIKWQFSKDVAFICATLLALAPVVAWNLTEASPDLASIALVVICLWLFTIVYEQDNGYYGLWCGLGMGVLTLLKAHYDILVIGWLVLLYYRKFRMVIVTFLSHFIPLGVWILLLTSVGLEYYNLEIRANSQGTWVFTEFITWPFLEQINYVMHDVTTYFWEFIAEFGPVTLMIGLMGLFHFDRQQCLSWGGFYCLLFLLIGRFCLQFDDHLLT